MKLRFLSLPLLVVLGLAAQSAADTFTLKDGTVLEGRLLRTEGDVYVIEYQVTKSIRDIKRVPRAQVAKHVQVAEDAKAFEAIGKLVPTPDLLTAEDYQQRIDAVKAFLAKYPKGTKVKEAGDVMKKLQAEYDVVKAGGRKYEGLMISGADYRADAYDMDARMHEAKIREAVKNSQWLPALRAFAELDKDFQGSASYRAVTPLVLRAMRALKGQVDASLASYDERMEKREADIEAMTGEDKANTRRAIDEQTAQLEQRYQAEKSAGQVWVTPHPSHRQSLEDCASQSESEIQRLSSPPEAGTGDPGKAYRAAWKVLRGEPDEEAAEKAMTDAQEAGVPEKYLGMLKEAAKASGVKVSDE